MNFRNPSGDVASHEKYLKVLLSVIVVSLADATRRAVLGQIFGKRVVHNYRDDLGRLMRKLILMSELAHCSLQMGDKHSERNSKFSPSGGVYVGNYESTTLDMGLAHGLEGLGSVQQVGDSFDYSDAQSANSKETGRLAASEKLEIIELLEEWEEPELKATEEEVRTPASR
jgi:hypothetical protein